MLSWKSTNSRSWVGSHGGMHFTTLTLEQELSKVWWFAGISIMFKCSPIIPQSKVTLPHLRALSNFGDALGWVCSSPHHKYASLRACSTHLIENNSDTSIIAHLWRSWVCCRPLTARIYMVEIKLICWTEGKTFFKNCHSVSYWYQIKQKNSPPNVSNSHQELQ